MHGPRLLQLGQVSVPIVIYLPGPRPLRRQGFVALADFSQSQGHQQACRGVGQMVLKLFAVTQQAQVFLSPAEMIFDTASRPLVVGMLGDTIAITPAMIWSA